MESSLCLWELVSIDYRNCTHQMVDPMPVVSHSCNDIYKYIYIYLLIYFSFIYLFKVYLLIYLYIFIYTYVITMETAGVGTKEQWKKKTKT